MKRRRNPYRSTPATQVASQVRRAAERIAHGERLPRGLVGARALDWIKAHRSQFERLVGHLSRKRRRNPRGSRYDRCIGEVSRRGGANPYAVCAPVRRNRRRRRNPAATYTIVAQRRGGRVLKYMGGARFEERGSPARFLTRAAAERIVRELKRDFPPLRNYTLSVL